jgi:hypothetical protein
MEGVLAGPGTVLAERYTIERELGRGGMAIVFLAHDIRHHRDVAVKVLRPQIASQLGAERFLREIAIAARLTHPHILPLHDSGESGDMLYYVMPFVGGESLRERLEREGPLPVEDALRIAREVADALAYAHAQGIVHRDIKPGNILLEAGHAVVADFGIARALSSATGEDLTTSGLAVGTPVYMSPEQVSGTRVDGRSDIYSLGCVLYEMLAGQPPFRGPDAQTVAARQLYESPPILASVRPEVPFQVAVVVEKALAKAPSDRFPDAGRLAAALQPSGLATVRRGPSRNWITGLGAAALLGGLAFAGWRASEGGSDARHPAWILVADFQGQPGAGTLTDAVRELVTAELDQSKHVATMPRQQLTAALRDAGLPDSVPVTVELARELAVRSSVRAILTGSIQSVRPGQYSIVVRVLDSESGNALLSATEAATDQDLVPQIQELGRQVRRGLGERRAAIEANKPLAQVATPSFDAYRKYVDALTLSAKGDAEGSNRLLREAIAVDSGFAAAWAQMSVNYAMARDADSSRLTLQEALKRPDRLNTAQRYRLEAEAAYRLRYDLPEATRWYELHLEHAPQSISGHNNLGVYLSSLGRYEEALAEFRIAVEIDPFGPAQAQVQIFNQAAMLLALGRAGEAHQVSRQLTGPFAEYAALLQATAAGRWSEVESIAAGPAMAPGTPSWLKAPAVTLRAGALAARGAVSSAAQMLGQAEVSAQRPASHSYRQAQIVLRLASGGRMSRVGAALLRDSTPGGVTLRGLAAVLEGDTAGARRALRGLQDLPSVELLRLGDGPRLLEALIAARAGRWVEVRNLLGPAALRGEHDGSSPAQVPSLATRLVLAEAYEEIRMLDSATAYLELAIAPTRVPFSHLALRGLAYPFAERRLAVLYRRMGQREMARRHWEAFAQDFITPDRDLAPLMRFDVEVGRGN